MAFQFNEHFKSSARITYLHQFRLGHIEYDDLSVSWQNFKYKRESEFYPKFPVIIQSNGLPWDIANSYLIRLAELKYSSGMESVNTRAKGLLAYLRFLEDAGLDFLHLPANNRQKAPYRFRSRLNELINSGLSVSYASSCIRSVVDFYKNIVKWKLINENIVSNEPYQKLELFINYISSDGLSRIKRVETADISIRTPKSQAPVDCIKDGGLLRPLSITEQKVLKRFINSPGINTILGLMIKIAVTTGARLQTICTLRNYHVDYLFSEMQRRIELGILKSGVELNTGVFRDIDTKNSAVHNLFFEQEIIEKLAIYSASEEHKKRMFISYYGEARSNYIFLTRDGNPFYTSRSEISERQLQESYRTTNGNIFSIKTGGAVEKLFKDLIHAMQEKHPEVKAFRFHDLRATFGMNLVRRLSSAGLSGLQILVAVRDRMGHRDIAVTQRYLDFDDMLNEMELITKRYESNLFGEA